MLWVKLTIIFGIIGICGYLCAKLMANTMDLDEQIACAQGRYNPKKILIPVLVALFSAVGSVVCLIVAIATW